MQKYSILTFNFNNYDSVKQPLVVSPNCQYVYITDNPQLKSDKMRIVLQDQKLKQFDNVWDKCFYIRYHAFQYVDTEYCFCIDASCGLLKSIDPIMQTFQEVTDDLGLLKHARRHSIQDQIPAWLRIRHYDPAKGMRQLQFRDLFSNYQDNILYQLTARIIKNTQLNTAVDTMTYGFLKYLGYKNNQSIQRLDQTVYTLVINHFFKDIKLLTYDTPQIIRSQYFWQTRHN